MTNFLLSCDWGTSAFRLRLVRAADGGILDEIISAEGMARVSDRWKQQGGQTGLSRESFAIRFLQTQLDALGAKTKQSLAGLPVLISGMASSSIGIRDLPYSKLPFSLDGGDAFTEAIPPGADGTHELLLISGLRAPADTMRGEETQVVGLGNWFADAGQHSVTGIFPGTHSKHIHVQAGKIVDFQTYLTGELFDLVAGKSILKEAVSAGSPGDPAGFEAFDRGIARARETNLLNALFSVRVNHLFSVFSREQNYHYLSGLLIGTELQALLDKDPGHILLCSGSNLYPLYQRGLEKLCGEKKITAVPPETMDRAAVEGQIKIFRQKYGG